MKNAPTYIVVICLLLVEIITFGIHIKHIGVYQDEWISMGLLHFAPHSLPDLIAVSLSDSRRLIRPLECLNIPVIYYWVWENPFWYHVASCIAEFASSWFLFLIVARLSDNRGLALAIAILFLVYPTHDSTHYSIVCLDLTIATAFIALSLWLFLKGLDEKRTVLILLSALAYFFSIYNYEAFLPLIVLYPLFIYMNRRQTKSSQSIGRLLLLLGPFICIALSLIWYRAYLLPSMHLGWNYQISFNLQNFISIITKGIEVNLGPQMWSFCFSMAANLLYDEMPKLRWIYLVAVLCVIFFCLYKQSYLKVNSPLTILLGVIILIMSYTIYGVSSQHIPAIDSWLNRVNVGGSLGACLILIGLPSMFLQRFIPYPKLKSFIFALTTTVLTGFFILVDWQFAKSWIISWKAQQGIIHTLKNKAGEIQTGDSIIIGGTPRYASKWAPIVDGIWDFQSMARITVNNKNINATVSTERLSMNKEMLIDRFDNTVLGSFPFKNMILYDPSKLAWVRISSQQEFIHEADKLGWNIPKEK